MGDLRRRSDFGSDDEYRAWFDAEYRANDESIHPDYFNADVPMPSAWVDRKAELDALSEAWDWEVEATNPGDGVCSDCGGEFSDLTDGLCSDCYAAFLDESVENVEVDRVDDRDGDDADDVPW